MCLLLCLGSAVTLNLSNCTNQFVTPDSCEFVNTFRQQLSCFLENTNNGMVQIFLTVWRL